MTSPDAPPSSPPLPAGVQGPVELIARLIHEFVATMDLDATLRRAVALVTDHVGAEAGSLFLLDENGREIRCHACCGPGDITGTKLSIDEGIIGRAIRTGEIQLVRDVGADPSFSDVVDRQTGFRTRSIICAPLRVHDQVLGAIELLNKRGGDRLFSDADRLALEVLAGSAALAILNARQAARLLEQERLRRELELAAEIQRSLLPADRKARFPVHGVNLPARGVSGDFFDFLVRPDGSVVFCLGDVSGKGMNAALLMAKTSGLHRCLARERRRRPSELLWILNRELCETSVRGMFVTMVSGVYDPRNGVVRLANAGHEPALLAATDGTFTALPAEAPPLGIVADASVGDFPETELRLDGGALYVVSDGVTEGRLPSGEPLGQEGLVRLLGAHAGEAATARLDAVVKALAPGALHDDVTLLVIDDTRDDLTVSDCDPHAATAPEAIVELRAPARTPSLKIIRDTVAEAARRAGCSPRTVADVSLAVDEACQNVIRHAYAGAPGEIVVAVERQTDDLVVHIRDFAREIDPAQVKPRDLEDLRPGGLGTHFIREVMDATDFLRPGAGTGNVLRLRKRIE